VLADLANVQVAQEELRGAEEEMRVQQEQMTQLLVQHEAERRWRGQLAAVVPVGLCVTDGNGTLVDADPALATYLGTALQQLRGKPLSVYLRPEDVSSFSSALRTLASGSAIEHRVQATVQPRHRPPDRASLFGFTEVGDHRSPVARIQWVLVPDSARTVGPETERTAPAAAVAPTPEDDDAIEGVIPTSDVISLATSLAELASLPIGELDRQRLLTRMATLVRDAVPAAEWVSITLGDPAKPQRLGSDTPEAQEFDGRQVQAGEGPCWEAYRSGSTVITNDVTADPRWRAWLARARCAACSPSRSGTTARRPVRSTSTPGG
jgi:PAS domain-containing protein